MTILAVTYRDGAIGVIREDGRQYDFIFGEREAAEGLASFLNVPLRG